MARPSKHDGVPYRRTESKFWWMRYRNRSGIRPPGTDRAANWREAKGNLWNGFGPEMKTSLKLFAGANDCRLMSGPMFQPMILKYIFAVG